MLIIAQVYPTGPFQATPRKSGRFPTREKDPLSSKRKLTDDQEQQRMEGLRILARIIARHYLEHPEAYRAAADTAVAVDGNRPAAAKEDAA